jgi:small subunit ribosomal protein S3
MIERTFIKKNMNKMELEDYLDKKLERAGFCGIDIIKTPLVTRIVLHVAKPGLAIGKGGATIKELTEKIASDYNIDNPQIEISEIKNPNLNSRILAKKMASMIERGYSWRSVSYRMIKDIMDSGAQGVELIVKGKLSGKGGRKRQQRVAIGYLKKRGYQSRYVDKFKAAAYPKAGAIGITLSIIHPDVVFPDKVDVNEVIAASRAIVKEAEEQAETTIEETKAEEEPVKDEKAKTETKKEAKVEEEKASKDKKAEPKKKKEGIVDKIKDVAHDIEEKVEDVVDDIKDKVTGKDDTKKEEKKEESKPEVKVEEKKDDKKVEEVKEEKKEEAK